MVASNLVGPILSVISLGGCPIVHPLMVLHEQGKVDYRYFPMGFERVPYALSTGAALQLVRFANGAVTPPRLIRELCYFDAVHVPDAAQCALFTSADIALIEVNTPIELIYDGFILNQNRFRERFVLPLREKEALRRLVNTWFGHGLLKGNELLRAESAAALEAAFAPETAEDELTLAFIRGTRSRHQGRDEILADLEQLKALLPMPLGAIIHHFNYMPDGRPVSIPATFFEDTVAALSAADVPWFDPAPLVAERGTAAMMLDDQRHYRPAVLDFVAGHYMSFMQTILATSRGPA